MTNVEHLLAMEKKEKLQLMEAKRPWYRKLFKEK
jgi:hypothetical protein